MPKSAKELREEAANLRHQIEEIVNKADEENRDLTTEEETRFDQIDQDYEKLISRAKRAEKIESLKDQEADDEGEDPEKRGQEPPKDNSKELKERREAVWTKYMISGMSYLNQEERDILQGFHKDMSPEQRALATGTDSAGGYTIPEGFSNRLEEALKAYGGVRSVAEVMSTATGNDIPWPTNDDTANKGVRIAENTQVAEQDTTFGSVTLGAYTYSSRAIRVPRQLLQDSYFNLNTWLPSKLAERIGRITNEEFTTGTGSAQPQGIVTGATSGVNAAGGATFTFDELIDLEHSINSAYRNGANFMFNDAALKIAKKLKDGDGNYLWKMGNVQNGTPDSLLGYSYVINDDMAAPATGVKSVLFGDMSKYKVRDVMDILLLRLDERYADYFQVGFMSFSRHDGRYVDAGSAVKALTQA